jgi:hypothetical protein
LVKIDESPNPKHRQESQKQDECSGTNKNSYIQDTARIEGTVNPSPGPESKIFHILSGFSSKLDWVVLIHIHLSFDIECNFLTSVIYLAFFTILEKG